MNEIFDVIIQKPEQWGHIIESAVGAHLINYSISYNFPVYYWRERNDEVDFIVEKRGKTIALEIKTNDSQSGKGLEVFNRKFKPDKSYLISNRGLSWQEFLKINPTELF